MPDIYAKGEQVNNYIGTIIVYQCVGNLPPAKIDPFMDRIKTNMKEWIDICKQQGYCVLFVPTRDGTTRIEKLDFTQRAKVEKKQFLAKGPTFNEMNKNKDSFPPFIHIDTPTLPDIKLSTLPEIKSVEQQYIYDKIQEPFNFGNVTIKHSDLMQTYDKVNVSTEINKQEAYTKMKIAEDVATFNSPGMFNLNGSYYSAQFVQSESTSTDEGKKTVSEYHPTEHTPIEPGTMTGTVYRNDKAIQTFVVSSSGVFTFEELVFSGVRPDAKAVSKGSSLDLNTGVITLKWNKKPGKNHCVVNYEYLLHC